MQLKEKREEVSVVGMTVEGEEATLSRTPASGVQAVAESFDLEPVHAAEIARAILGGRPVPAPLDPPPLPGSVARVALHIAGVEEPLILVAKATSKMTQHGILLMMRPIDERTRELLERVAAMFSTPPATTEESVTRQFFVDDVMETVRDRPMFPAPETKPAIDSPDDEHVPTGFSIEVTFEDLAEAHAKAVHHRREAVRHRREAETIVDGTPLPQTPVPPAPQSHTALTQTAITRTAETRVREPIAPSTLPSLIDSYADDQPDDSTLIKRNERNAVMPPPLPGHEESVSFGRYQLLERIGAGSMAAVHRGRIVSTGGFERQVAIKVMHQHLVDDPRFRNMFLDEARLAARIHHPNVVATIDVLQDGEAMMLVMQYVAGPTLRGVLNEAQEKERLVPLGITIRIITDVLAGLHAAHETVDDEGEPLKLVHRDVSPPNILVGRDGVTRVSDFGVALAEHRLTKTHDRAIKGKVPYMPPEQAKCGEVDRRADIYGTGCMLWEMLTGERLFADENEMRLLFEVLEGATRSPRDVLPYVPAEISDVCMRALALEPDDRFADAADFAAALEDAAKACGVRIATSRELSTFVKAIESGELMSLSESLYPPAEPTPALRSSDAPVTLARASTPPTKRRSLRTAALGILSVAALAAGALFGAKSYGLDHHVPALAALEPAAAEIASDALTPLIDGASSHHEGVAELGEKAKSKTKRVYKPRAAPPKAAPPATASEAPPAAPAVPTEVPAEPSP